ncbi:MAG: hypothetical protein EAX86_02155 [Candidatus Heimdallarchaeota archaeon]|nr:hypothetical protein [Candidatus Heimdallarchaeota archaeon]
MVNISVVERKQKGQFFTKTEIAVKVVTEICNDLIGYLDQGNKKDYSMFINKILNIKLIDPAMGDGVFLVVALEYFTKIIQDIWGEIVKDNNVRAKNDFKERFRINGMNNALTELDRDLICLKILSEMIYGVEVDRFIYEKAIQNILGLFNVPEVIEMAKKLVKIKIKQGNSLISPLPLEFKKSFKFLSLFKSEINLIVKNREAISKLILEGSDVLIKRKFIENSQIRNLVISKLKGEFSDSSQLLYLTLLKKKEQIPFFWELEYPEVFLSNKFGFDVVIGNPPWDKWKLYDREWLGSTVLSSPELIKETINGAPSESKLKYLELKEYYKETSKYFNTCYKWQPGEKNLYKLFLERFYDLTSEMGYFGIIIPSGILGEYFSKSLRKMLLENVKLISVTEIVSNKEIFSEVEPGISISVILAQKNTPDVTFLFSKDIHSLDDFKQAQMRLIEINNTNHVRMNRNEIISTSPHYIIPSIRNNKELAVTRKIISFPSLTSKEWKCKTSRGLDMTNDRNMLTKDPNAYPLVEGRHLVRLGYDDKHPRFWIQSPQRYFEKFPFWRRTFIGWKNFSGNHRRRRMRIAIFPKSTFISNSILCLYDFPEQEDIEYYLAGVLCSVPFEFRIRQICYGLNINQFIIKKMNIPAYEMKNPLHKALVNLIKDFEPIGINWAYRKMEASSSSAKSALEKDYYLYIAQIDALVALIYNLTKEEFIVTLQAHQRLESSYTEAAVNSYTKFSQNFN